ncbi:CBN-ALY-2 protein [Caenorhabditis brenneri]|uniref:CBN-ALY-2 protein n=1 Tax=Caenorhabditis brenneri TaxID=135651 RepID=G0NMM3_CAEBE|nr:CBN-ALY-2 protein [Caenorhabditis brenneri]
MVKASSIDMALSDIISSKKSERKKGGKKPIKRVTGGIRKRGSTSNAGTPRRQSGGGGRGGARKFTTSSGGLNDKRTVRLNISNLARSVMSSDLEELFQDFNLRKVSVHFGEDGTPSGTADIILSKRDADRLVKDYAGVLLDQKVMHFAIIETSGNAARAAEARGTPNRRNSTGRPSNGRPANKINAKSPRSQKSTAKKSLTKKPKRDAKPQKTAEELDAELDAYMSRS